MRVDVTYRYENGTWWSQVQWNSDLSPIFAADPSLDECRRLTAELIASICPPFDTLLELTYEVADAPRS